MNTKLFHKVGRLNKLTENGSMIFGFCRRMFEVSEEMSKIVLNGTPTSTRHIQLGVSDDVERSLISEVVSHFLKKYPDDKCPLLSIVSGDQADLLKKLKIKDLDIVISELAGGDVDLLNLSRADSPVVMICGSSAPEQKGHSNKESNVSMLSRLQARSGLQWIVPSRKMKLRSEINQFLLDKKIRGRIVLESGVIASLISAVSDELGLALIPLLYVRKELKKKSIRILGSKKGHWLYNLWLIGDSGSTDDSLIKSFTESFEAVVGAPKSGPKVA